MPYRIRHKRKTANKIRKALIRFNRRRRRRIPQGMPTKKLVKLKYATTVSLNASASTPNYKYFSCNGMYAPEIVGGHSPLFYNQWMSNYDHYQVIGSSMRVTQVPTGASNSNPALWGIILDDETTFSYTNAAQIVESNQGRNFRQCQNGSSGLNTNGRNPRLIKKFSAKKHLGDLSDKHEGSATSNPTDQMFYGLWVASPDTGATDPNNMTFMVEISYIAILKEPKFIAQS